MPSRDIYKKRRYLFPMGAQSAQSTWSALVCVITCTLVLPAVSVISSVLASPYAARYHWDPAAGMAAPQ